MFLCIKTQFIHLENSYYKYICKIIFRKYLVSIRLLHHFCFFHCTKHCLIIYLVTVFILTILKMLFTCMMLIFYFLHSFSVIFCTDPIAALWGSLDPKLKTPDLQCTNYSSSKMVHYCFVLPGITVCLHIFNSKFRIR